MYPAGPVRALAVPVMFAALMASAADARAADDPRLLATASALSRLAPHVTPSSHPDALRIAFQAYYNYRAARPQEVRKPYLYFVDLGLDNRTPRGYVFDMESLTLVDGPFTVAHGVGSSGQRNGVPATFSNRPGSLASSLGLYLAEETYDFRGRTGAGTYSSVGLRMRGESGPFNDAARRRGIVAHGAPYVSGRDAGRSEGCPAMEQHRARRLLPMLADGGVVFIFSPNDRHWLRSDPWLSGG
ncbi:MAG TPA: murein L,D-transpeptidase catalytic domain family protein [Longimicrobiales bacterium]|nr:murein L,D-transpeptidase catalytic domain family protein [Longimicrobiales bacterium]